MSNLNSVGNFQIKVRFLVRFDCSMFKPNFRCERRPLNASILKGSSPGTITTFPKSQLSWICARLTASNIQTLSSTNFSDSAFRPQTEGDQWHVSTHRIKTAFSRHNSMAIHILNHLKKLLGITGLPRLHGK